AVAGGRDVRPPRLTRRRAGPDAREVGTGLPRLLVEPLRVVDLRLGEGPGRGTRRRGAGCTHAREGAAVDEIGDVQDGEHHEERAERGSRPEYAYSLSELLRLRATRVVAVQQPPRRDHHQRDERRLPE